SNPVAITSALGTDCLSLIALVANVPAAPDLVLTKTASRNPVAPGEQFSYLLNVTNVGPTTATAVDLRDTLPSGVGYVSGGGPGSGFPALTVDFTPPSPIGCEVSLPAITCAIGTVLPGGSAAVTIVV